MTRQVKEIPILAGKDARRFEKVLSQSEENRVSRESYERAIKAFNSVSSLAFYHPAPHASPSPVPNGICGTTVIYL